MLLSAFSLKRKATHELITDHTVERGGLAPMFSPPAAMFSSPPHSVLYAHAAHSLAKLSAKSSNEDTYVSCQLPWVPQETMLTQTDDGGSQQLAASTAGQALLPPMHLLAVFDGHSSASVSQMCAEQLPVVVTQLLRREAAAAAAAGPAAVDVDALLPRLLPEAFQQLDDAIEPLDNSGTTATVAVITPQRIHLAWVGDSRAVLLGQGGQVLGFTEEHRATREDEQDRVAAAGGSVFNNSGLRVMGILQCTRAIGDKDLQPYGVIPTPDVLSLPRTGQEEFLVLATDGLWDFVSNKVVYDFAIKTAKKAEQHPTEQQTEQQEKKGRCGACYAARAAARLLASHARKRHGSRDDITVMIVNLRATCSCVNPPTMLSSAAASASSSSTDSILASSSTGGGASGRQAGASVSSGSQLHSSPAALGEQPVVTLEAAACAQQQQQQSQQTPALRSARKPPPHHHQQQQHSPMQPLQQSLPVTLQQHRPSHHPSKWRPGAAHAGLVLQPSVCPSAAAAAAAAHEAGQQQHAGEGTHSAFLSDLALSSPFALMLKGAVAEVEVEVDVIVPEVSDFSKSSSGSAGVVSGGSAPPSLMAALAQNSTGGLRKRSLSVALGNSRSCGSTGVACEAHGEPQPSVVVLT